MVNVRFYSYISIVLRSEHRSSLGKKKPFLLKNSY